MNATRAAGGCGQHLLSRSTPEPAGAPTSADSRIQAGSSAGLGTGCIDVWLPAICRIGPFSHVRSCDEEQIFEAVNPSSRAKLPA